LSVRVIVLGKQGTLGVQSRKESQKDDNKTFYHYLPLAQDVHVSTHNLQCSRQFKKRRQINLFQAFGAETYAGRIQLNSNRSTRCVGQMSGYLPNAKRKMDNTTDQAKVRLPSRLTVAR